MEITAQKQKATNEKGPATVLEPGTYALSWSFSHASHGDRSRSLVPHSFPLMYRSQVCRYPATLKTCALEAGTVCYVMVAGSAVPSTLHEFVSLRWKAASISVCAMSIYLHQLTNNSMHSCEDGGLICQKAGYSEDTNPSLGEMSFV